MEDTQERRSRAFLSKLGFVTIYAALLCNPALLAAFKYGGSIESPRLRAFIYAGEVALLLLGATFLALRSSPKVVSLISPLVERRAGLLEAVLFVIYGILTLEAMSYAAFFYLTPSAIRSRALFTVDLSSPGAAELVPKIKPYLWSNYAPNPLSSHANSFGWRYGGGPRRHELRILCIGGSTTWSDGVSSPERSYPAQLEGYLRSEGYDVDVVNGGAAYYTSAELIGTLAFRGVYTQPDIVLIHTGGNDVEPLLVPAEYEPDYSHWRVPRAFPSYASSRDDLFAMIWRIPSWTARFVAALSLKPDARSGLKLGRQTARAGDAFFATNDVSDRYPEGLARNLRTLIGISRIHGALPATILFNPQTDRMHRFFRFHGLTENPDLYRRVRARADAGYRISNQAMRSVSEELGVPVIPFDSFAPSSPDSWLDYLHLDDEGSREKGVFIGEWLIENGILEEALGER